MEGLLDKMVVQSVTSDKREFNLHKIPAIDTNVILSRLTEADYCKTELMIPLELLTQFEEYPKIIENTEKSLGNVILNLNSKHLETKSTIPGVGKRYA
jgi:DNA polymerase-3 subunit alpha/error-prone DNA polymerase